MKKIFCLTILVVAMATMAMAGGVTEKSICCFPDTQSGIEGNIKAQVDALILDFKRAKVNKVIPDDKIFFVKCRGAADKRAALPGESNDQYANERAAQVVDYIKGHSRPEFTLEEDLIVVKWGAGDEPNEKSVLVKWELIPKKECPSCEDGETSVQEKSGPTGGIIIKTDKFVFSVKAGYEILVLAGTGASDESKGYAQVDAEYGRLGIRAYGSYAQGDTDEEFNGEETLLVIGPTVNGKIGKTVTYRLGVLAGIYKDVESYELGEKIKKENQNGAIMPFVEVSLTDLGGAKWADFLVEAEGLILLSKDNEVTFQDALTNGPEELDTDSFRTGEYGQVLAFWRTPLSGVLVGGGAYFDSYKEQGIGAVRLNLNLSEAIKIRAEGMNYGGDDWKVGASMGFSF